MGILTRKFSQFVAANYNATNRTVGLSGGVNAIFNDPITWTTAGRPTTPANGLLGYNTDLKEYEYYDSSIPGWVQLVTGSVINNAKYIVQVPDVGLPNAQALSLLDSGVMVSETITGEVSTITRVNDALLVSRANGDAFWTNTQVPAYTMVGDINMGGNDISNIPHILDSNGNINLAFVESGSAVNYLQILNNSTGNNPSIIGTGSDSNVVLNILSKGGTFVFGDSTSTNPGLILIGDHLGTHVLGLTVPSVLSSNTFYTFPGDLPASSGYVLSADTSGIMSWVANGSGGVTLSQVQAGDMNFSTDGGAVNAIAVTMSPIVAALTDDLIIRVRVANTNTSNTPTLQVDSNPATTISLPGNVPVAIGDIPVDGISVFIYNSTNVKFELQNPAISLNSASNTSLGKFNSVLDVGAADAYVATNPYFPTQALSEGQPVTLLVANGSSGAAATFTYNGIGPNSILLPNGGDPAVNDMQPNMNSILIWNSAGTFWMLTNPLTSGGGGGVTAGDIQTQAFTYWLDTGPSADNYVITPSPAIVAYADGQRFSFKAANNNTGTFAENLNVNGIGAASIITNDNNSLLIGMILANSQYDVEYNSTFNSFVLLNPTGVATVGGVQSRTYTYQFDVGSVNAYALGVGAIPVPNTVNFGQQFAFVPANTNTGASTFTPAPAQSPVAITYRDGSALIGGEIVASQNATVEWAWNLANWVIVNPAFIKSATVYGTQTDDDAPAGFLGEYLFQEVLVGAEVPVTANTATDVAMLTLTEGDWMTSGNICVDPDVATTVTELGAYIGDTSATAPTAPNGGAYNSIIGISAVGANNFCMTTGERRVTVPNGTTQNIYLGTFVNFTGSTLSAYGFIWARRPR